MNRVIVITLACFLLTFAASSGWSIDNATDNLTGDVSPTPAPDWEISQLINANPGNVEDNRDRVIVIDFFQLWCPVCNTLTGPLMQKWQDRFSDEIASGDLLLVKIQTVFEGHDYQNEQRLKKYLVEKGITLPVGVDLLHDNDDLPETKKRYETSGTPEVVMIDRQGMIRFRKFGSFDPEAAETYLESLLSGAVSQKRSEPVEICLASELCGET